MDSPTTGTITVCIHSVDAGEQQPSLYLQIESCGQTVYTTKSRRCAAFATNETFEFEYLGDRHSHPSVVYKLCSTGKTLATFETYDATKKFSGVLKDSSCAIEVDVSYEHESGNPIDGTNYMMPFSYFLLAIMWGLCQVVEIPYYVWLLFVTACLIYIGSHMSLETIRRDPYANVSDDADGDTNIADAPEIMKKEDAMKFPLVGSLALFSIYLAFKYLGKEWVNFLLGFYFSLVGLITLSIFCLPIVKVLVGDKIYLIKRKFSICHSLPSLIVNHLTGPSPINFDIQISLADVVNFAIAATIIYFYHTTKGWTLNNIIAFALTISGISQISIGSFKIGCMLLVGLFFYDIFWVFGTDVMVTVAKNLDGPIKILVPRSLKRNDDGELGLSMLGLGDIVIPGFFLALLLRFDATKADAPLGARGVHFSFPKPYFHSSLVSYLLGLSTTLVAMIKFNAAQPALLYLVPAILTSSLGCALWKGELKELLDYEEVEVGNDEDKKEK